MTESPLPPAATRPASFQSPADLGPPVDLAGACREFARALLVFRCEALRAVGVAPSATHVPAAEVERFASVGDAPVLQGATDEARAARERLDRAFQDARLAEPPPPLARLGPALGLSDDEVLLVAVLYAIETTPILREVARSCAGDPIESSLTPLFLAETIGALDHARTRTLLRALGPGGAVRRHVLIESPGVSAPGPRDPIVLEPTLRAWLSSERAPDTDPRLVKARDDLQAGYWDDLAVRRVRSALALAARRSPRAFRLACVGNDPSATRRLLAAVFAEAGQVMLATPRPQTRQRPSPGAGEGRLLALALRDARLLDAVALIEDPEPWLERPEAIARIVAHAGPLVFSSRAPLPDLLLHVPDLVEVQIPPPSPETRERYVAALLGDAADAPAIARRIGRNYAAPLEVVEAAVAQARSSPEGLTAASLYGAVRDQLRVHLGDLADVVPVGQGMEDLVLPEESLARLREMIAGFRHRERVLRQWGFAAKVGRGGGWTALFYGPPGTGKTMAAGIVARELGLEVYRVDLSRVVDKYIGETEKHLARVFDEAERGQVMLLFDEADSLFGRRTSGGTATDRYANMEVNYLLQRMERYEGVVVLTTNNDRLLDEAFRRRLRYTVHFPMPDAGERERIWRGMVPAEAEVEGDLDFGVLARSYEMSGGHIRNAVLRAAYMAAEEGGGISQDRLRRAADAEYRALGRVVREQVEEEG